MADAARLKARNPIIRVAINGAVDAGKLAVRAGKAVASMILPKEVRNSFPVELIIT